MVVIAAKAFRWSTMLATGQRPVTSPPMTAQTFDPGVLAGLDIGYVCLHGAAGMPVWFGQALGGPMVAAITAEQLRAADIAGSVWYLAGCWGAGVMSDALMEAGASAVVGDRDSNWAGRFRPVGSNKLGQLWLRHVKRGYSAGQALQFAKDDYPVRTDRDRALCSSVSLLGDESARLIRV